MHAVLVETGGKQRYIFSTNKLREVVGASQLIAASTTAWVTCAVESIESDDSLDVDIVLAVSGYALITVRGDSRERELKTCRQLIWTVTRKGLTFAPGLQVSGVSLCLDERSEVTKEDLEKLHRELDKAREAGSAPEARLQRLPVTRACRTSDGPASGRFDDGSGDGPEELSEASIAKRSNNKEGRVRIARLLGPYDSIPASKMERHLSGDVKWLGVVHADGNRFGAMLYRLDAMPATRTFQRWYAETSSALQECGERALRDATKILNRLHKGGELPLIPLIASGDDLTVLIDGRFALPFTAAYLRAFEKYTHESPVLREVAEKLAGRGELTASAGVAIVKPHFPFSVAYRLAEQACASAKRLYRLAMTEHGMPVSALDWHVHYDSVGANLPELRAAQRTIDGRSLLRRPYAMDPPPAVEPVTRGRSWARLAGLVGDLPVLPHPDPGEALPATQLYRLRRVLREDGGDVADQLFRVLCHRPELAKLRRIGSAGETETSNSPGGSSLFETVRRLDSAKRETEKSALLLDFLDAREFFGRDEDDDAAEPGDGDDPAEDGATEFGQVPAGGVR